MGLRFYLDENVPVAIAAQLNRRGIEAVTARDLKALGASDQNHLQRAIVGGYVFCTHDADFVDMAVHGIGDWVRHLELLHAVFEAEEMHNRIEYL